MDETLDSNKQDIMSLDKQQWKASYRNWNFTNEQSQKDRKYKNCEVSNIKERNINE